MPRQPRAAVPYDEPPMQTSASTPTDRAVPGDGVRLHARAWGGRGPLHGLASDARIRDGVAPRLAGAGLRVVALDLRGHGASDQPGDGYGFAQVGRGRMAPPRFALPLADRLARARFRVENHMQAVEALARFTGEAAGRG